jgi:hypothetical protein
MDRAHRANIKYCEERGKAHAHDPSPTLEAELNTREACHACSHLNTPFHAEGKPDMFVNPQVVAEKADWRKGRFFDKTEYRCQSGYEMVDKDFANGKLTIANSRGCCLHTERAGELAADELLTGLKNAVNSREFPEFTFNRDDGNRSTLYNAARSVFAGSNLLFDAVLDHTSLGMTVVLADHVLTELANSAGSRLRRSVDHSLVRDDAAALAKKVDASWHDKLGRVAQDTVQKMVWWVLKTVMSYSAFVFVWGEFFARFLDNVNDHFATAYLQDQYSVFEEEVWDARGDDDISSCDTEIEDRVHADLRAHKAKYAMWYLNSIEQELRQTVNLDSMVQFVRTNTLFQVVDTYTSGLFSKFLISVLRIIEEFMRKIIIDTMLRAFRGVLAKIDMTDYFARLLGGLRRYRMRHCGSLTRANMVQFVFRTLSTQKPTESIEEYGKYFDQLWPGSAPPSEDDRQAFEEETRSENRRRAIEIAREHAVLTAERSDRLDSVVRMLAGDDAEQLVAFGDKVLHQEVATSDLEQRFKDAEAGAGGAGTGAGAESDDLEARFAQLG